MKEINVLYSTDGKGNWIRREWKPQCSEKVFLSGQCQGVEGHDDVHWCYDLSGAFRWQDNDRDRRHDGCSGDTPPEHKSYVSPKKMAKLYYMSHFEDTVITDPKIVAKLEKNNPPERGATITRPVSSPQIRKLMKEIKHGKF